MQRVRLSRWAVSSYETDDDVAREREALREHVELVGPEEDAEIVVVTSSRRIGARELAGAPSARLILTTTSGYDHLDLDAIRAHGAAAARCPLARRDAVVEHALRHLLAGLQRLPVQTEAAREGRWVRSELPTIAPKALADATVGVVGCGVIGTRMIEVLHALGATVVAADPVGTPAGVAAWSTARMAAEADAVTLHCHLTPETRRMVDDAWLSAARGLVLVNTARGAICDVEAVVRALDDRRLSYAGLDVFPDEPPPSLSAWARRPDLVVTPHSAGFSTGLAARVRREVVTTAVAFARGERLPHPIG